MRKALSFVLVLALILGSFSFAFAADTKADVKTYPDVVGQDCEGAVTVLSALGVVNGYADGTYQPAKVVTRAEMAKLLIVALGMDEYVAGTYSSFTDVAGHWANSYIAYAASMSIIEGYPDGTFRPDNTVTYQEAITMTVRALGYQDQYLTGVWPASHVSMAKSLGILDGIVATADGANRGDIAILLYNALTEPTVTYSSTGDLKDNGASMLERLDGVKGEAGVLTSDGMYVKADGDYKDYKNQTCDIADIVDLSAFYGYYVVPYIYENDDDEWEIIAVGDIKGTAYEVEDLTKNGFSYNDNDYKISGDIQTSMVNDQWTDDDDYVMAGEEDAIIIVNGDLKKTGTKIYSSMQWRVDGAVKIDEDQPDDIVTYIDDEDDVKNFLGTNSKLVWEEDDEEFDVEVIGDVSSLTDIEEDDVVFVYDDGTANKEIVRLEVARQVVEGNVTSIKTRTGKATKYTIDGTAYEFTDTNGITGTVKSGKIESGDDWKFFLDPNGDIFYAEESDNMGDYAVILDYDFDTKASKGADASGNYNRTYEVTFMDNQGAVNTLSLKGYFDKDGKSEDDDVDFNGTGDASDLQSGVIFTYETEKSGKIDEIEICGTEGVKKGLKVTKSGWFNGYEVEDDAVIFMFDGTSTADMTDDADWSITTKDKILTEELDEAAYYLKDGKIDAMIIYGDITNDDDMFGVVNSYESTTDEDGDKNYTIYAIVNGEEMTLTTEDRGNNFDVLDQNDAGDLYKFITNSEGVVTDIISVNANANKFKVDNKGDFGGITVLGGIADIANAEVTKYEKNEYIQVAGGQTYDIDDAVIYTVVLDDDDYFDGYKLGSASDVRAAGTGIDGAHVLIFDTDDDKDDNDYVTVMVVFRAADWNDAHPNK